MAQEDYLSGSQFGQVAGSLLASKRKRDKKSFQKALLATALFESFGALQKQQKQTIMDNAQDVKEKYNDIFTLNQAEFDSYSNERDLLKRYNDNKERFLNEEVAKIIDNTDEAVAARVKWADVEKEPNKELRDSMYDAYNDEREKLINKMEALKVDPRATTRTFAEFNRRAKDEYMAALKLVEDDPTKKGLMRAAWNRIFKTKVDEETGELVSTNEKLLKLQKDLEDAKAARSTFRDQIENQVAVEQLYKPLIFKDKSKSPDATYAAVIPDLISSVKQLGIEEYENVDGNFYIELINTIQNENPDFIEQQIKDKAFTDILKGDIDPSKYLSRRGLKLANGRLLIQEFEKQSVEENKIAFEKDPMLLFQVMDAYKRDGQETVAQGLSITYEDVYKSNKDFEPTQQQKTNYVEKLRVQLDPKLDKELLNDTDSQGVLANNAANAENYFKKNNPSWNKTYTNTEIEAAALAFVLGNMETNSTQVRMTSVDLIGLKPFDMSLIDNLPTYITDLKKANRSNELQQLRDEFVNQIQNPTLELEQDEIFEGINKINDAFRNENVSTVSNNNDVPKNIIPEISEDDMTDFDLAIKNYRESVIEPSIEKRNINEQMKKIKSQNVDNFREAISKITPTGAIGFFTETQKEKDAREKLQPVWDIIKERYDINKGALTGPRARIFAMNNPEIAKEITDLINNYKL